MMMVVVVVVYMTTDIDNLRHPNSPRIEIINVLYALCTAYEVLVDNLCKVIWNFGGSAEIDREPIEVQARVLRAQKGLRVKEGGL